MRAGAAADEDEEAAQIAAGMGESECLECFECDRVTEEALVSSKNVLLCAVRAAGGGGGESRTAASTTTSVAAEEAEEAAKSAVREVLSDLFAAVEVLGESWRVLALVAPEGR